MPKVILKLEATYDKIPDGDADNPEFLQWCIDNRIHPLGGPRRAWCDWLGTYIRDASYLVRFTDADGVLLMTAEEFENAKSDT